MRLSVFLLSLALGGAAHAQVGTWSLTAESGACDLSFVAEAVDDGIFFVDRGEGGCGDDIDLITGYALNEEGAVVVFYSTLEGVEQVGQVARQEDGSYTGKARSGAVLRLEHKSGSRDIADPVAGNRADVEGGSTPDGAMTAPEPDTESAADAPLAQAGDCLVYAGGTTCADQTDIGPPQGGALQVLSRMNMRDAGTTDGSNVVGRIEAGSCLQATLCSEDGQGRLWCGVQGDAGTGFILKQDGETVYARNSCN